MVAMLGVDMRLQYKGAYIKYVDNTGKLYLPIAVGGKGRQPCKQTFSTATAAENYGNAVSIRYARLKTYA